MTRKKNAPQQQRSLSPATEDLSGLRDWHIFALYAILGLVFFREILFQTSFFWEDFLYQFYPYRVFSTVSLAHGELPLWNPYTFGGMPFLADITGTTLYLPALLLVPFVSGGTLHYWYVEVFQILHVLLAGAGMFYCARGFGLARVGAGFAGLAYMFSGFMAVHGIHLVVICQAAWFPIAVLLFKRTLEERSARRMALTGVVLFLIVCSGHIQVTLYFFFFLLVYFVADTVARARADRWTIASVATYTGLAAGAVLIAIGLSMIQILPTAELTELSKRDTMSFAASTEGQLSWQGLITLVIPKFFGSSNHLGGSNPTLYWGPQRYWAYWETCLYGGIVAFLLALVAFPQIKKRRDLAIVAGFAVFALLFALGDNFVVHRLFFDYIPGFNKFRAPGRWGFFVVFAVVLLGGSGLDALFSRTAAATAVRRTLPIIAGGMILFAFAVAGGVFDDFIRWQLRTSDLRDASPTAAFALARGIARDQTLLAAGFAVLTAGGAFLLWTRKFSARLALFLLAGALFADLYAFGYDQNNSKNNIGEYFARRAGLINQLKKEGESELFRVNSRNPAGMILDRNQGMVDRIFLLEGYTQLSLKRVYPPAASSDAMYRLMNAKYRLFMDTVMQNGRAGVRARFGVDSLYLPRAFLVYDARVCSSPEEASAVMSDRSFNPRDAVILEDRPDIMPVPSPSADTGTVHILRYRNNSITMKVSTPRDGILVTSEIYYPDWVGYVDGAERRVLQADWSLRALVVERGEHIVELRYEPRSFAHGAALTGTTAVATVAILAVSTLRKRKRALTSSTHPPPSEGNAS